MYFPVFEGLVLASTESATSEQSAISFFLHCPTDSQNIGAIHRRCAGCGLWIWLPSLFFDFQKKVKMEVGRGRKKAIDAKTGQTRRLRRKGLNASNVVREALCMDLLLAFLSRHGPGWRRLVASQVLQDRSRSRRDCWKP